MKKIVIITNIPSPYRVAHYKFLQKVYKEYGFYIIFSKKESKSELREWGTSTAELENVNYLPCFAIVIKRKYDDHEIHITHGVGKKLSIIRPDVVICMEYNPTSIQAVLWCKWHKIPVISLTDGTLYSERNIGYLQKISRKFIMRNADAFIASSTKAKEKIESYHVGKNIYVSYLTVDVDKYFYEKVTNIVQGQLIFVGSLIERKGVDLLFKALAKVKVDYYLRIVGSGPLEQELKELAKRLDIDKKVEFCGYKQEEEVAELYRESNILVLPTREDCYGLVILEAMCASLPVIASKYADGAYDLIEEGKDGMIIDPYDTERFADSIDRMLVYNMKDNQWGRNAYRHAHEFSFERVSISFMNAVEETLAFAGTKKRITIVFEGSKDRI